MPNAKKQKIHLLTIKNRFIMKTKLFGIIISAILLSGCATYFMTPQSLQSVLEKGKPTHLNVVDKDGKEVVIEPTIHTGIRITKKDDSRQTFYFVTAYLKDSSIMGSQSAIFDIPIKPIKVSDIKKVEFDGR
jgi:hypothetical protein